LGESVPVALHCYEDLLPALLRPTLLCVLSGDRAGERLAPMDEIGASPGGDGWHEEMAGQTALVEGQPVTSTGIVERADGETLTIKCDGALWPAGEAHQVEASVFCPGALFRVSGTAVAAGKVLSFGADVIIERIQRRRWPRRNLDLTVTLCPVQAWNEPEGVPGHTIDLSVGGMHVECLRPLPAGCDPLAMLFLPDGTEVVTETVTVSTEAADGCWRYRLAFQDLDEGATQHLIALTGAASSIPPG